MTRSREIKIAALAALAALVTVTEVTSAAVIGVPGDQPTIQDAIMVAVSGDEVVVEPGVYNEILDLLGKDILVRSAAGPQVTVLDGTDLEDSIVRCVTGETAGTILRGFTITNGTGDLIDFPNSVGGGLYCNGGSPTIQNCLFEDNTAGNGGGVAAIASTASFTNCVFVGNRATLSGGAVYNDASDTTFVNCTLYGNISSTTGGAVLNTASDPFIVNCILWNNMPNEIVSFGGSSPAISFSDVQGGAIGTGNKNVDPAFVDARGGDFHLTSGSLVIDAGNNSFFPGSLTTDADGAPRFIDDPDTLDTGVPAAPITDMGAFEFGRVLNVDQNVRYATIQLAIDDAADGDELLVVQGRHRETLDFGGLDIALRSVAGAEATILDGTGFPDSVVKMTSGEGPMAILDGFTITGGSGNSDAITVPIGGGVYIDMSRPTILNCIFRENEAEIGAGLYSSDGDVTIRRCTFVNNTATNSGGGMYLVGSEASVSSCLFAGNVAPGGGGIAFDVGSPEVLNCAFSGNEGTFGGAISTAGGGNVLLVNCSLVGNDAIVSGGAAFVSGTSLTMVNSIVWDNTSPNAQIAGTSVITYSDVQGGYPGAGNINALPMFVNVLGGDGVLGTADDNLRLVAGSPCIDAGSNSEVEECVLDLQGRIRRTDDPVTADTGAGVAPIVDMGAFEFGSVNGDDCNLNGLDDACDVSPTFIDSSAQLIPFAFGFQQTFIVPNAPVALSDVLLEFSASADLAATFELVNVLINDDSVGAVFEIGASACPVVPDTDSILVPMAVYNAALAGETGATIDMNPTTDVEITPCPSSYIQVQVSYTYQPPNDLDGNGIPDDCPLPDCPEDLNGDLSVGFADLNALLSKWGACAQPCPEDLDSNGSVGFADLNLLLTAWGPCA